ncbi:MAG: hypothetical protein ACAI44_12130 [Candidatus Sericytochromatia bacterium]
MTELEIALTAVLPEFDQALERKHQPVMTTPVLVSASLRDRLDSNRLRRAWKRVHRLFRLNRANGDAAALLSAFVACPDLDLAAALRISFSLDSPDMAQPDWPYLTEPG